MQIKVLRWCSFCSTNVYRWNHRGLKMEELIFWAIAALPPRIHPGSCSYGYCFICSCKLKTAWTEIFEPKSSTIYHNRLYKKNLTNNGINVFFINGLNYMKCVWNLNVKTLKNSDSLSFSCLTSPDEKVLR